MGNFFATFQGTYRLHLQSNESVNSPITLKIKAVRFFETSERNYPILGANSADDLVPEQSLGGNVK